MTDPGTARRAAAVVLAVALALAPAVARGFVRTTDPRTGQALAWPIPIVTWHLNRDWPEAAPSCRTPPGGADPVLAAASASFAAWEQSCTDLRLLYAGPLAELRTGGAASGDNVVVFRRGWCSQNAAAMSDPAGCMDDPDLDCGATYGCFEDPKSCAGSSSCAAWGIVAQTSVLYVPGTGRIVDADVEMNGWDGTANVPVSPPVHGWYFTCYPGSQPAATCTSYGQDDCAYMDLQNTLTHEVGHLVGLRHPCTKLDPDTNQPLDPDLPLCADNDPRTMAPTTRQRETEKRSLHSDDVAGVCAVYPSSSGGCGCGAGGGGAGALLLGALLALRRRPTRPPAPRSPPPAARRR